MCNHRALTRWHKFWARLMAVYAVGILVPEVYALVTVGPDASCSGWWWHSLGTREPCRHSRAGRTVIVTVGLWLIVHLGWGRGGFALPRWPFRRRDG